MALASAGILAAGLAGCGSGSGSNNGTGNTAGGPSGSFILGTTDPVTAVDPAGSYDFGSWNIQYNIFQQLMDVPAGQSTPQPDAAKSCAYSDPQTIKCVLRPNLKFSNGDALTSADVKYSFERNIAINNPNGSAVLLGSITDATNADHPKLAANAIETPDPSTVIFHLNRPDQTFLSVLTTATASIVDQQVYPADKLLPDAKAIGSGPYTLAQYQAGQQAVFQANPNYQGPNTPKTKQVFVSYFNDPAPLKQAVESGQVDIAWRTLSPTDLNDLQSSGKVDVIHGQGSEFRYWVFDLGTKVGKQLAIRQAVAQLIDRNAISKNAYDGTVKPAYSIVPPGFAGQKDSFKTRYGAPSVDKAKAILQAAGIKTPIAIKLGYTPTHYGPNAVDEANELKTELTNSGLFTVSVDDAEWTQYQTLYKQGAYDLYILGWYPDFLDADDYLTPFIRDGGFFANHYSNKTVDKLLDQELGETDASKRSQIIGQLQDIVARDVPLVPSWDGQNVAVASKSMQGVSDTLDPTYIFRFWMISKK
ncbi:MAG: ABC transporter substrate-binding protein [Nocardioidaceae bacterium]